MTTPIERTRALRMTWEFLWEMQSADNLSAELKAFVERELEHYPSPEEIDAWARKGPVGVAQSPLYEQWLAPEPPDSPSTSDPSAAPTELDRSPVTPKQRMRSIFAASALLHGHLCIGGQLTIEQRRRRTAVARHFPIGVELVAMALREGFELPFNVSEEDFLRVGKSAFMLANRVSRTNAKSHGVPADSELANLEARLDQARKSQRP